MIIIDLLKNHPDAIPRCVEIWHEVLGKIWNPEIPVERITERLNEHLNEDVLPMTFVALDMDKPVGMCSLREHNGIRLDITPCLGSLVVDPIYQKKGIGKMLIDATKNKAKCLGFSKLYLFTFEKTVADYYARLGWVLIGGDEFKGHPTIVMEMGL